MTIVTAESAACLAGRHVFDARSRTASTTNGDNTQAAIIASKTLGVCWPARRKRAMMPMTPTAVASRAMRRSEPTSQLMRAALEAEVEHRERGRECCGNLKREHGQRSLRLDGQPPDREEGDDRHLA